MGKGAIAPCPPSLGSITLSGGHAEPVIGPRARADPLALLTLPLVTRDNQNRPHFPGDHRRCRLFVA